ncbi:MFS transporter [Aestuariispira insulae]|uniref:DHA1 family tetracycline resistance protein-like MFS transporter n=1 Tax=Aestuariispira insulae TaxID=1461337 RepID=A0A3D9HG95_9PROT|nr:MFS transporter [Aestuariispira insulae]RED48522.1 DHA1 family tetracycline resistance protein-like MFS transporter [Aestuariispira insulae]
MSEVKRLLPLAGATCVAMIGLGVIIPFLPFNAKDYGADDFWAPVIFSTFSLAAFISTPIWGALSDRFGRKPIMMVSMFFSILSYLWLANADALWELYASRAMAGFTAGWMATSQAYIADITGPENRAKGMGLLGASFGIGFLVGPLIAVMIGFDGVDYSLPYFIAAGFAAASLIVTIAFVPEPERHRQVSGRKRLELLRDPVLARMVGFYFLISLMFTAVEGVFAIWAMAKFNLGPQDVGVFLVYSGVIMVLVQGGIGRIVRKRGESKVSILAVAILLAAFVSVPFISGPNGIYIPMGLFALAMGLFNPAMQGLLSRCAPEGRQGGVMGIAQSGASLARVGGPAWAGFAFREMGADWPFLIGAVLLVPIILFGVFATRRAQGHAESLKAAEGEVSA